MAPSIEKKQPGGSVHSDDSPSPPQSYLKDPDQAYTFLENVGAAHGGDLPSAGLASLRRKVDWRIVPLMFLCYTMQFIDKVSLNVSNVLFAQPTCSEVWMRETHRLVSVCCGHGPAQAIAASGQRLL